MNDLNVYDLPGPGRARRGLRPAYTLRCRQSVPRGLAETFAFFERPENLPRITPPWLGLELLTPGPLVMARGLLLDYRVRALGLGMRWRSLISEYDPPHGFRDVQVIGPYRRWDHRHRFLRQGDGTLIEDLVEYALPFGPLGALVHRLHVRRQLEAIFEFRRRATARLLAPRSGSPAASDGAAR